MNPITLRVVEGADRGRVYENIATPITVGREEGNSIQLNDERISRFHLKIQQDHEHLVLTDLESTNGTKVNGEEAQLRILRYGDVISVGRSTLLYGSREEINKRLQPLKDESSLRQSVPSDHDGGAIAPAHWKEDANYQLMLHEFEPPDLPSRLSPGQAAQLSEVLEYIHIRLRKLISQVEVEAKGQNIHFDIREWQYLLDIQARLSEYLRRIGHPENGN